MTNFKESKTPLVGILLEASEEFCIAMFAIFKAGMAFVPIDESIPKNRLKTILEQSNIRTIITSRKFFDILRSIDILEVVILMDAKDEKMPTYNKLKVIQWSDEKKLYKSRSFKREYDPKKPCYLIYTSGTTGQPKGVPISHSNLFPLMMWQKKTFNIDQKTNLLQTLSLSFDFGIQEVLTTLLFGGTLIFCSKDEKINPKSYRRLLHENKITMLYSTPSFLESFVNDEKFPSLKVILVGGETFKFSLAYKLVKVTSRSCKIFNGYGPTEASINTTMHLVDSEKDQKFYSASIPIGKVSGNNTVYILNESYRMVPTLVEGEIYIGGPGLSEGYWNNSKETMLRFKSHPYQFGERIYKTGDKGRYLPNGTIEFLGRLDNQIKVRGYRIETYEIEEVIKRFPLIKEGVVLVRSQADGANCLVCYFISYQSEQLDLESLCAHLSETLPSYMIPQYFVQLQTFPINKNGKLDEAKLPDYLVCGLRIQQESTGPMLPLEQIIVEEFKQALSLPDIGVNQNFFEIGAHSLLVGKVHAKLTEKLKFDFPISKLFLYPSAKLLAKHLSGDQQSQNDSLLDRSRASKQRGSMQARLKARGRAS